MFLILTFFNLEKILFCICHMRVYVIQNYIEELSTLRELIQKIIKRYIKRNNWSTNKTMPISLESKYLEIFILLRYLFYFCYKITDNCGWVGDTLCLISLAQHGLTKTTILRILNQRGYTNDLEVFCLFYIIFIKLMIIYKVTEMNWAIFRMTFGFFILLEFYHIRMNTLKKPFKLYF